MKICLFNPGLENNYGVPSANLGDLIIEEAVNREIKHIFNDGKIFNISTHSFPEQKQILQASISSLVFVGGTNLLGSSMDKYKQWKLSLLQKILLRKAILLGVGWERYQVRPNFYTRLSLKAVLSCRFLHSVRDEYTKEKLESAGIKNVVNTGCPTMWQLANFKSSDFPTIKANNALVMLTDYCQRPEIDLKLLKLISNKYQKVFFWPQGKNDLKYFKELIGNSENNYVLLEHSLASFENFLASETEFDYIGTRLHGGIKCLVNCKRSLIVAIDNRAKEIAKHTNLPIADRSDFDKISHWIDEPSITNIKINLNAINQWKFQFSKYIVAA